MDEGRREVIAMLTVLKENSYSGNPQVARNFTIIKDCKKDSFDYVIDKAIAYIVRSDEDEETN